MLPWPGTCSLNCYSSLLTVSLPHLLFFSQITMDFWDNTKADALSNLTLRLNWDRGTWRQLATPPSASSLYGCLWWVHWLGSWCQPGTVHTLHTSIYSCSSLHHPHSLGFGKELLSDQQTLEWLYSRFSLFPQPVFIEIKSTSKFSISTEFYLCLNIPFLDNWYWCQIKIDLLPSQYLTQTA